MRLAALILALSITIRYVDALKINFPSTPTADTINAFSWTKEEDDPSTVWLRKQKLDDSTGATPWSSDVVVLVLTQQSGNSTIHVNRAGLFSIGVFNKPDDPNKSHGIFPMSTMQVTVLVNPTSAGAILPTSTSSTSSTSSTPASNPTQTKSDTSNDPLQSQNNKMRPSTALIVGLTLGLATLLVIIAAAVLLARYRCRRGVCSVQTPFQRNQMIREMDNESLSDCEKIDSPPAIQTIYSIPSDGSFSVTSPIAAAAREREQKEKKFLRLSFTTISSAMMSRSTTTVTRNSHLTDVSDAPLPPLPPRTRTDRQMLIEQKIQLLQSKMIMLHGRTGRQSSSPASVRPLPPLPPGSPSSTFLPATPSTLNPPSSDVQPELERLKQTVERMKELHESDWALGLTDVAPEGLHD